MPDQRGLPSLSVDDFEAYFGALWRQPDGTQLRCFEWQLDLVQQVAAEHRWPDLIDLPTGAGKTSLLDIAVFLLALDADLPPAERWMPHRIVLVVDRRVIVDQADERGSRIAAVLSDSQDPVLTTVAQRLRSRFGGDHEDPPLVTSVLRGGIVRDESWARRPDVPALISSTVDQVGSRMLFRGYGVGNGMRPVQAGLLSHDCLFLLDEVHLSRPMAETLGALASWRSPQPAVDGWPDRWQVVQMSATPIGDAEGQRFPAYRFEPTDDVLRRRLEASKPAQLHVARRDRLVVSCTDQAIRLARQHERARAIGIVVNRVRTATEIADHLQTVIARRKLDADVVLLTGRMRPIDRDRVVADLRPRVEIGRDRTGAERLLFLVATQSIEAGADFDLDGLVTECASLDALRQRFGRVDRDGRLSAASGPAMSVIVARESDVKPDATDPVYGRALAATWRWLEQLDGIDFGIRRLPEPSADELDAMTPPVAHAPRLLPVHLDLWAQTAPRPTVEPEVSAWLHGTHHEVAEVQIAWRADLTEDLLSSPDAHDQLDVAVRRVRACPPASGELLTLTIGVARRWLSGAARDDLDLTDAGELVVNAEQDGQQSRERLAVRWDGRDTTVVRPREIRPGDVLVVPATYGGLRRETWCPSPPVSAEHGADPAQTPQPVPDVAREAIERQRNRVVLRILPDFWRRSTLPEPEALLALTASERREAIRAWLKSEDATSASEVVPTADMTDRGEPTPPAPEPVASTTAFDPTLALRPDLRRSKLDQLRLEMVPEPDTVPGVDPMLVVTVPLSYQARRPVPGVGSLELDADAGGELTSFVGQAGVSLDAHLNGVAEWVRRFAQRAGLSAQLIHDLELAARLHDLGKVDPRFQVWMLGGDVTAYDPRRPVAKSVIAQYDRARRHAARERAGYPADARHELGTIAMCANVRELAGRAHDWDLVLHLIASHHGLCRPFAGVVDDPEPQRLVWQVDGVTLSASSAHGLARLDAGIASRFWRATRRYGWFGLAYLEALLRLADHRRSEQEAPTEAPERAQEEAGVGA